MPRVARDTPGDFMPARGCGRLCVRAQSSACITTPGGADSNNVVLLTCGWFNVGPPASILAQH